MFIHVNGQRLFFDCVGEKLKIEGPALREKPTLIVMHGGPGFDHARMRPDFDHFADIAQVVYIDHRGNGRSQPSEPKTWTLSQWGDDVKGLCDALGIEKPFVFGQSFGGMVAQSYLTRYPDHSAGVILSSTAARMDLPYIFDYFERKGGAEARAIAERFWLKLEDQDFADYMRVCMPLYGAKPPADPDQGRRSIVAREVMRHFSGVNGEIKRMDFRPNLGRTQCPVLVLSGTEDPVTPAHLAEEIYAHLPPRLRALHIFPGTGHGAYRDEPEKVWPIVRAWMAAHAPSL